MASNGNKRPKPEAVAKAQAVLDVDTRERVNAFRDALQAVFDEFGMELQVFSEIRPVFRPKTGGE